MRPDSRPRRRWRSREQACSRRSGPLGNRPRRFAPQPSRWGAGWVRPEVFDLILSELRKVVPYTSATIQELDGDELVIVSGQGFPEHRRAGRTAVRGAGPPRPLRRGDGAARGRHRPRRLQGPAIRGCLRRWEHQGVDGGTPARRRPPDRDADDRQLRARLLHAEHARTAEAFAAFAATAIDKARYLAELERAREHAETLLTVTQVLGKTLSLEHTIEAILDELQRVVPYDSCSVQVISGQPPGDRGRARVRRSGGCPRAGLRP